MRTYRILKISEGTIEYTFDERTGNYDSEDGSRGLMDFLTLNDVKILKIGRNRDGQPFSITDRVKVGNGRTIHKISVIDIEGNKIICGLIQESNGSTSYHDLDQLVKYVEPARNTSPSTRTTTATVTLSNDALASLEQQIISAYPRAIRLERVLKQRPSSETIKDFLIKFFSGKGDMELGWNYSRNTVYVDTPEEVQTPLGKRRSLGDIFMICKYYYPSLTLKELLKLLYVDLFDHYDTGFRSNKCGQIHKRVWYFSSESDTLYLNKSTTDEYSITKEQYIRLLNN